MYRILLLGALLTAACGTVPVELHVGEPAEPGGDPPIRIQIFDEEAVAGLEDAGPPPCVRIGERMGRVRFQSFTPGRAVTYTLDPTVYGAFDGTGELLPLPLQGVAAEAFGRRYRNGLPGGPGGGLPDVAAHGGGSLRENTLEGRLLRELLAAPGNPLGVPCPSCRICGVDETDCRRTFPVCSDLIISTYNRVFGTSHRLRGAPPEFPPLEGDVPLPVELAERCVRGELDCQPFREGLCNRSNACRCFEHRPATVVPFFGQIRPERVVWDPSPHRRDTCEPARVVELAGLEGGQGPREPEEGGEASGACEVALRRALAVCTGENPARR